NRYHHHSQDREQKLGAQKITQHRVHLRNSGRDNLAIPLVVNGIDDDVSEFASIFEEKNRQNGDQQQPPQALNGPGCAQDKRLDGINDLSPMVHQEALNAVPRLSAPAVLGGHLAYDLASADLLS